MDSRPASRNPLSGRDVIAQTGSYILRHLAADIPLSADGSSGNIEITCVEVWNENLYIGTSAGEILHFVLIPPDPNDPSDQPSFILASRLQPASNQAAGSGIQQILLLPKVAKACIICNNTLTFYSLPELSPAFPGTKPLTCAWVGGVDLDLEYEPQGTPEEGVVIMLCLKSRIRLVRIGEEPRKVRDIEFGGCLSTARRDNVACAADAHSYALLDVVHQQKIHLFPISTLDEDASAIVGGGAEDISTAQSQPVSRSVSSASAAPKATTREDRGHSRSSSLGIFNQSTERRQESPRPTSSQRYGFDVPEVLQRLHSPAPAISPDRQTHRAGSPVPRSVSPNKPLPPPPSEQPTQAQVVPKPPQKFTPLRPHIVSPTPSEFLLTTGTSSSEPGVGLFVNLDGDVVPGRGTIEFTSYPKALLVDGGGMDASDIPGPGETSEEGFVLAVVNRQSGGNEEMSVEIQRWDLNPGEENASKEWLDLEPIKGGSGGKESNGNLGSLGIRTVVEKTDISVPEISEKLALKKLVIQGESNDSSKASQSETVREREEAQFASRMCILRTRIVLWTGNQVWWVLRNPMIVRLDAKLRLAQASSSTEGDSRIEPNCEKVKEVLNEIRGQEPRTEAEFLSLRYIRQKASLLLFIDLILRTSASTIAFEHDKRSTEEALIEGEIDPRVILTLLPLLREEVVYGPSGIWIPGGLKEIVEDFVSQHDPSNIPSSPSGPFGDNILQLIKRYLFVWRRKKGFGSVADEKEIFHTVDAALIRVLLLLDSQSPKGPATTGSIRTELNGVVDSGVDCFDRAVSLLEDAERLYVLSRLYQSRKMASHVLATWKRIIDGEPDLGGEFNDGEQKLFEYLTRIRDPKVVEEYGTWLANRNPKLGVQVFANDSSRVKFKPAEAVAILKAKAPGAVKDYLEHLVFGKKLTQYANDLIAFYLDIVLEELSASETSRAILLQTYETYRALRPPKPTYRQFITDNAIDSEWWHSRLRLLQLLGGNQGEASSYDVPAILSRLEVYDQVLVPEMIILNGRQGRHEEAIRLLTHGLGDFDTAISYCLLGGSSIFRPLSGFISPGSIPSHEEQSRLFGYLLHEFLRIDDMTDRLERTSELLERFGSWFDVADVLSKIPDSWSIELFSAFLISALRRLVWERSETTITKALNGAQNLRTSGKLIEKMDDIGCVVEDTGVMAAPR